MTIMSDQPLGDDSTIPRPALILGGAGVLPFLALGAAALVMPDGYWSSQAASAVVLYGALILSFLGGIRWGFAIQPFNKSDLWLQLCISVAPSLYAWGVLLVSKPHAPLALILGLVAMLVIDLQFVKQGRAPSWFGKLRVGLTIGACAGLAMAAIG